LIFICYWYCANPSERYNVNTDYNKRRVLRFRSFLAVAAMALSGCTPAPTVPKVDPLISVRLGQVQSADSAQNVDGAGTLALRLETPLGFTSTGRIARILVQEGDVVQRGQLLAVLDTTSVEADLSAATAEAVRAEAELKRSTTLLKDGWVTQPRVDSARASAEAARAAVRARRFANDTAKIVAPNSGIILARSAEPSQVVSAGTPVVVIGEASGGFVLRVALSDRDVARVTRGAPASVQFEGLGPEVFKGQVIEVGGRAESGTGAFEIEIAVPRDARLRSGLIGTAVISAAPPQVTAKRVIVPPTALLAPRAGGALVYVVGDDNRARLRTVTIGDARDEGVVVTGGIAAGEWVAVAALDRLRDGQQVVPVKTR
jgi:RND family efflux transporter MFP subunit